MSDEFKFVDPPKYKVRVFIAADGGNWVEGHDEAHTIQEGTLDEAVDWMKKHIESYDDQAVREWAAAVEAREREWEDEIKKR